MNYSRVPALIAKICGDEATSFKLRTELLFDRLKAMDRNAILAHIEYGGVIPEAYSHDSSEEKLFAKYCDYLLAKALAELGMKSSVIEERADSADVIAKVRKYSLVGDAKCFASVGPRRTRRISRVEAEILELLPVANQEDEDKDEAKRRALIERAREVARTWREGQE